MVDGYNGYTMLHPGVNVYINKKHMILLVLSRESMGINVHGGNWWSLLVIMDHSLIPCV